MSDGAGAAILVSEKVLKELGLAPLARLVGFAVGGVAPEIMGVGPIAAIPKVLHGTGLAQDQLDWIELNEAFAAQSLAVIATSASIRRRSIRWAARSRSGIRSARPARSARRRSCTACGGASRSTAW